MTIILEIGYALMLVTLGASIGMRIHQPKCVPVKAKRKKK